MKPETETTIMKDHFMKSKKEAVTCLRAMGAELPEGMDPYSWEGVMTMYEDVLAHGKADKRAAAGMAVMKWMHYHEECATYEALEKAERMLESEMEAPAEEPAPVEPAKPAARAVPAAVSAEAAARK